MIERKRSPNGRRHGKLGQAGEAHCSVAHRYPQGLNRLRKKSASGRKEIPQGLKPSYVWLLRPD
jgi:hypothetical protein